jgi:C4-dicarboxylate-specific signal transduction histidine kinase
MKSYSHVFNEIDSSERSIDYAHQINQQKKLAQLGEMVAMIAHQWRQPLNAISATAINLSLKVQMEEFYPEEIEKGAFFIQNQCQKMSQTIETFMEFVKPSKEASYFFLRHSIDEALKLIDRQLYTHNISIKIIEEQEGIKIFGYEDQFEQVLLNLLSNARDAFDEVDHDEKNLILSISLGDEGECVLSIEDNGGGVPEAVRDKIFNPFFTNKEDGKGTGLGLYMSMEIIKKSFDSTLRHTPIKGGSRFEIVFNPTITSLGL